MKERLCIFSGIVIAFFMQITHVITADGKTAPEWQLLDNMWMMPNCVNVILGFKKVAQGPGAKVAGLYGRYLIKRFYLPRENNARRDNTLCKLHKHYGPLAVWLEKGAPSEYPAISPELLRLFRALYGTLSRKEASSSFTDEELKHLNVLETEMSQQRKIDEAGSPASFHASQKHKSGESREGPAKKCVCDCARDCNHMNKSEAYKEPAKKSPSKIRSAYNMLKGKVSQRG